MPVVLGIDAAWTAAQPSGIALVATADASGRAASRPDGARRGATRAGWRCLALAPSYASFLALAASRGVDGRAKPAVGGVDWRAKPAGGIDWRAKPAGGIADPSALVDACVAIAGAPPDVIAIDMPLSHAPITARRAADNLVSSAFGRFGLGVHTPSAERPGPLADAMHAGFAARGYRLATAAPAAPDGRATTTAAPDGRATTTAAPDGRATTTAAPDGRATTMAADGRATTTARPRRALLEVYPHAAVIRLLAAEYRVPYKLARATKYWPELDAAARRRKIVGAWRTILRALARDIDGIELRIPARGFAARGPAAHLKRYEDALDAVVCAWVGMQYLAGNVRAYGDATSAVWA